MSSLRTALLSLITVITVITFSNSAASRPGGGGIVMGTARGVAIGGLAIDYSRAQRSTPSTLTVTWKSGLLTANAGSREHRLTLADWEMRDLLRIALDTAADGRVEVSIDRVAGTKTKFASAALRIGPQFSPIGDWLLNADVQFAEVASMGASTKNENLRSLAPNAHAQRLLETDAGYQKLARDVVAPLFPWPMIVFNVGSLDEATPVTWHATFRPQFRTPDGQVLEAEPNHPWIDPEMERQALRPYEALAEAVRSQSSSGRDLLRSDFPLLAAAEKYALALTILEVHCARKASQCREWQRSLSDDAPTAAPAPLPGSDAPDVDLWMLAATWLSVRLDLATHERDGQYRCWIFVDETIFSLGFGARYPLNETLAILPKDRCYGSEAGTWVRLFEPLAKALAELTSPNPQDSRLIGELRKVELAIKQLPKARKLSKEAKALWIDRAAFALRSLSDLPLAGKSSDAQQKLATMFSKVSNECVEAVRLDAKRAREAPTSMTAEKLRYSFARLHRCVWYPTQEVLLTSASFHFAIGMHEAQSSESDAAMHSRDRLRMLQSHAAIAATESPRDVAAIDKLVTKLARTVSNDGAQ